MDRRPAGRSSVAGRSRQGSAGRDGRSRACARPRCGPRGRRRARPGSGWSWRSGRWRSGGWPGVRGPCATCVLPTPTRANRMMDSSAWSRCSKSAAPGSPVSGSGSVSVRAAKMPLTCGTTDRRPGLLTAGRSTGSPTPSSCSRCWRCAPVRRRPVRHLARATANPPHSPPGCGRRGPGGSLRGDAPRGRRRPVSRAVSRLWRSRPPARRSWTSLRQATTARPTSRPPRTCRALGCPSQRPLPSRRWPPRRSALRCTATVGRSAS